MQRITNIRLRPRTVIILVIIAGIIGCGAMYVYERQQQRSAWQQHYGCGTTTDGNTICS